MVAFFVDSDFDTEKVCVFPLPIILAEAASSVAFDSFELLLEERLEKSAQYGVKVRLVALGEIDPTDLSTLKVPLVPSDSPRKNSTGLPRLSFPFKRISPESPALSGEIVNIIF